MFNRLIVTAIIAVALLLAGLAAPALAQEPTPTPPVRRYSIESENYITYTVPYTCADLPALMSGFGLNVAKLQATYDAGWVTPVEGYRWLGAAVWVSAGEPVSCMMLDEMRFTADIAQRVTNEYANYSAWTGRAVSNGVQWTYQGGMYATGVVSVTTFMATAWAEWLWTMIDQGLSAATTRAANDGRNLANEVIGAWNVFLENAAAAMSGVLDEAMLIWNSSVLPVYQHLYGAQIVVVGGTEEPASAWDNLWDFVWWLFGVVGSFLEFIWWLFTLLVQLFLSLAGLPLTFFNAFNAALSSPGYSTGISCSGDAFWCPFLAGVSLLNTVVGDDIAYPLVIVGIVIATIAIFWRDIWDVLSQSVS